MVGGLSRQYVANKDPRPKSAEEPHLPPQKTGATAHLDQFVGVAMTTPLLARLDTYRASLPGVPSRQAAIRRLIELIENA